MSDLEFDILDELYFLSSFQQLRENLGIDENVLKAELLALVKKGWARIFEKETDEELSDLDYFDINYKNYNYLASKEGLLAHNSR